MNLDLVLQEFVEEEAGEARGIVADDAVLLEEFVNDAFEAESLEDFDVIFHGQRALFAIAIEDGAAGHAIIQDHPIENLFFGVLEDCLDVIGRLEFGCFAGLGHQIADVDALGARSGDGVGDARNQ